MRAHVVIAALVAAAVALPLSGCFGLPSPDELVGQAGDLASQAEDLASQAQELADTFSSIEWGKVSRLVVKDAKTGKVIREVTDQAEVEKAFESLSGSSENDLAEKPDADAEYVLAQGYADAVAVGRSHLADPSWAGKVLQGREPNPCFRCKPCRWFTDSRQCPARNRDKRE